MAPHIVKVRSIEKLTHDVLQIKTDKPSHYTFEPGQATDVAIHKDGWQHERRPFTFTSLPAEPFLAFVIKTYPERQGVTNQLLQVIPGDELMLHDVFGAISYQGPGVFIAGGAGITPFLPILRCLQQEGRLQGNTLLFANKTKRDIILEPELRQMLGHHFVNILSAEQQEGYAHGHITKDFLMPYTGNGHCKYYLCGPALMMEAVEAQLAGLGISGEAIVKEAF